MENKIKMTLKERIILATIVAVIFGIISLFIHKPHLLFGVVIGSYGYQFLAHWLCKRYDVDWF